jgi:hypothetical protein
VGVEPVLPGPFLSERSEEADARNGWLKGLSPEERAKIDEYYKKRYGS